MAVKEVARRSSSGLDPKVKSYMDRLVSPLFGPIRRLSTTCYDASSPCEFTILPELTDIHHRIGLPSAPQYHLGGFGFSVAATLFPSRFDSRQIVTGPEIRRQVPQLQVSDTQTVTGRLLELAIERYRIFALDLSAPDIISLGFRPETSQGVLHPPASLS